MTSSSNSCFMHSIEQPKSEIAKKDISQASGTLQGRTMKIATALQGDVTFTDVKRREQISQAKKRAFESAKVLGKGLLKIQRQGFFGRTVQPKYWLAEVITRSNPRPKIETEMLKECWILQVILPL